MLVGILEGEWRWMWGFTCVHGERRDDAGRHIMTASTSCRGDEGADGSLASREARFGRFRLVFTSPPVGLRPHCRSCERGRTCFSIALYHLKSYNDIYTDWSLYHKFVAKISAQTNNIKKYIYINTLICTHRHLSYYYTCLHAYTNM